MSVKVTQFDQHAVVCGCGKVHTATRPGGARTGPVGGVRVLAGRAPSADPPVRGPAGVVDRCCAVRRVRRRHARPYRHGVDRGPPQDPYPDHVGGVVMDETSLRSGAGRPGRAVTRRRSICWSPPPSSTPSSCWGTVTWRRARPRSSPGWPPPARSSCTPAATCTTTTCSSATRTTSPSPGWRANYAPSTWLGILTAPPRCTPRTAGPPDRRRDAGPDPPAQPGSPRHRR